MYWGCNYFLVIKTLGLLKFLHISVIMLEKHERKPIKCFEAAYSIWLEYFVESHLSVVLSPNFQGLVSSFDGFIIG